MTSKHLITCAYSYTRISLVVLLTIVGVRMYLLLFLANFLYLLSFLRVGLITS